MATLPATLSKFTSAPTALLILTNRTLRLSRLSSLNDPFDGFFQPYWMFHRPDASPQVAAWFRRLLGSPTPRVDKPASARLQRMRDDLAGLEPDARDTAIECFLKTNFVTEFMRGVTSLAGRHHQQDMARVLSMCGDYLHGDLLMWSHYAGNHQGARIDFDPNRLSTDLELAPHPVDYIDEPSQPLPVAEFLDWLFFDKPETSREFGPIVKLTILSKATPWRYEAEWRYFDMHTAGDPPDFEEKPFSRDAITSVTLGCRMPGAYEASIRAVCGAYSPPLPVQRLKRCPTAFRLEPELGSNAPPAAPPGPTRTA